MRKVSSFLDPSLSFRADPFRIAHCKPCIKISYFFSPRPRRQFSLLGLSAEVGAIGNIEMEKRERGKKVFQFAPTATRIWALYMGGSGETKLPLALGRCPYHQDHFSILLSQWRKRFCHFPVHGLRAQIITVQCTDLFGLQMIRFV